MLINWQREQERKSKIILKGNLWGYFLKEVFLHKQMEFQATVNEGCGKDFLKTLVCLRSVNRGFHLYFPCACIVHEGFAAFPLISATWRTSRGCRLGKLTETPPAENTNENRTGCAGANVWKGFELLTTTQRFDQKYIEKLQHRPRNWREGGNSFIYKRNPTQLRFSFNPNQQTNKQTKPHRVPNDGVDSPAPHTPSEQQSSASAVTSQSDWLAAAARNTQVFPGAAD